MQSPTVPTSGSSRARRTPTPCPSGGSSSPRRPTVRTNGATSGPLSSQVPPFGVVADRDEKGVRHARPRRSIAQCARLQCQRPGAPTALEGRDRASRSWRRPDRPGRDRLLRTTTPQAGEVDEGWPSLFSMLPHHWANQLDPTCLKISRPTSTMSRGMARSPSGRNETAKALGVDPKTVTTHIRHLTDLGIVRPEPDGQHKVEYRLLEPVSSAQVEHEGWGGNSPSQTRRGWEEIPPPNREGWGEIPSLSGSTWSRTPLSSTGSRAPVDGECLEGGSSEEKLKVLVEKFPGCVQEPTS